MKAKTINAFVAMDIDDFIFHRINDISYHQNPYISISDLSYIPLLHYGFDEQIHKGEIICNKIIASKVISIFKTFLDAKYQIQSIRLIDDFAGKDSASMKANNTSSFNYRKIINSDRLSYHALGLAIDLNPLYNPLIKKVGNELLIYPEESRPYVDRIREFPHKITHEDYAFRIFTEHGFSWGGDWVTLKDYQHFEYKQ